MAQVFALGALFHSLSACVHEMFHTYAFNTLQFNSVTSPCAVAGFFLRDRPRFLHTPKCLGLDKIDLQDKIQKGITP